MSNRIGKRRRAIYAVVLVSIISLVAFVDMGAPHPKSPELTGVVTVVTYNIDARTQPDEWTAVLLRETGADVICLQEVTPAAFSFLRRELGANYPASLYHDHGGGFGGLAFFSRYQLDDRAWIAPTSPAWFPAWFVEAETPAGRVQILNVHLRPRIADVGGKLVGHFTAGRMHRREIESLLRSAAPGVPTVVLGDFNDFDGDPALTFLVDRGFGNALAGFGLAPTWTGEVLGVRIQSCIDHILYSQDFECTAARVISGGGSDHQPVVATLRHRATTTTAP